MWHDAFEMGKDRHPRLALHQPHQPLAAARHDHVDTVGHRQHLRSPRRGRGWAPAGSRPRAGRRRAARRRGRHGSRPSCESSPTRRAGSPRCPALRQSAPGIGGDVRSAFVDHADHAERRAHAADVQAAGHVPFGHHLPDRIVLRRDRAQASRRCPQSAPRPASAGRASRPTAPFRGRIPCPRALAAEDLLHGGLRRHRPRLPAPCACSADEAKASSAAAARARRADVGHDLRDIGEILHSTMSSLWISAARPDSRESVRCHRSAAR